MHNGNSIKLLTGSFIFNPVHIVALLIDLVSGNSHIELANAISEQLALVQLVSLQNACLYASPC